MSQDYDNNYNSKCHYKVVQTYDVIRFEIATCIIRSSPFTKVTEQNLQNKH